MLKGAVISGRFEVEHLSGAGGMGQVYRAHDVETGEPVAIKVLTQAGTAEVERFTREAELLATLHHPGIVRYVGGGATPEGVPYLAMEWLDGETLAERLKRVQLNVGESLALGMRVASALGAVHQRGAVHRDIKPSNIFLRGGYVDDATLIDFGIARPSEGGSQLTLPGAMLGTPGYMAPEQANGVSDVDARADVFSLGCVLFRCLSGSAPFPGTDALSVLLKVVGAEPLRLRDVPLAVPADLDELVAQMLSKSRDARPRDGAVVARALQAIADVTPMSSGVVAVRAGAAAELTGVERRVMSLVLGRRREGSTDATLPVAESGGRERAVRGLAERHRGKPAILADGSILIAMSSADAATDLAAQAGRCALGLRSLFEGGPVVVVSGREIPGPVLPTGELIDRAVELLRDAPEGGSVRVDAVTAGLLGPAFDVEADLVHEGGDSPTTPSPTDRTAFYLRGEASEPDRQRPLLGKPTVCVGRERELLLLESLFEQSVDERMAHAVVISAPAGVGKSRLVHELLRKLEVRGAVVEIWSGQGDPISAGSAFGLLSPVLRRAAGILDGEPIEARRRKLRARVGRHLGEGAARVAALLGELIGTPFGDEADPMVTALRGDPVALGEHMRRAFLSFLEAECRASPVLLVLEDLHWGDLPTVRFIDSALCDLHDQPLLVLALGRPELHLLFPRLWAARGAQEIRLRELSRRASERLVRQALGDSVGQDTLHALLDRADGHAFYLEELIRAVAAGKGNELPETVLAMVQARLERLDAEVRRVLRAASVFGETFWKGGIEALLGATGSAAWLTELREQEVIAVIERGRFPAQVEYRFRHSLVREAAYGMLTENDRVLGHRLAGEWLEQAGETDAMVLGEHFERGTALERAVVWFLRAAEQALEGGDLEAVTLRTTRALACGATGATRGALLGMQGYMHTWRTNYVAAATCYREALPELEPGGIQWYLAIGGGLHASASIGDFDHVDDLIKALRAGMRESAAMVAPLQGLSAAVPVLCVAGQYDLACAFIERVAPAPEGEGDSDGSSVDAEIDVARCHYAHFAGAGPWALHVYALAALSRGERAGDARVIHMAQAYQGVALIKLGAGDRGERRLRDAREAALSRGLNLVGQFADLFLADALTNRMALDEADKLLQECRTQSEQSVLWGAVWSLSSARIARRRRELGGARALVRAALAVVGALSPGYSAHAAGILSAIELEAGAPDRARALANESNALLDAVGTWYNDVSIRVYTADVLYATGDRAAARRALAIARALIDARAADIEDAEYRASYLARIPENAHAAALERAWAE
jgi:ATP/maltotriose-dependent transcriptional regulator MalT